MARPTIARFTAREILDSRGNPTLEVDCILANGIMGRASVPSGASVGSFEALEMRDKDPKRYLGKGVLKAIANIHDVISPRLVGMDATDQFQIDQILIELDGTKNKSKLGANAILGVSLAVCRAAAVCAGLPIYRLLGGAGTRFTPTPFLNIINGGLHAPNNLDFQEYMIVPAGFPTFRDAIRAAAEIYQTLKKILEIRKLPTTVGDEGGMAPNFSSNEEPLQIIMQAIEQAGYIPGEQVYLAIDVAASTIYHDGAYLLSNPEKRTVTANELIDLYADWTERYPIISIEDGLAEEDWAGWHELTSRLGKRVQLVGDDIFVTNIDRLRRGIQEGAANAVLVKPTQIGTVSETIDCVKVAMENGYRAIVSHRSGETDDHFIADLAVAVNCGQIKTGAPCRGERTAKYNRLIRIEEEDRLPYAGLKTLSR
ncbi:phosphopyruvate hydratase [candidate division WOR-3 bacterium]|nr:phosphopyruvate hydratase [candidate division WOR-3 bacterium]